MCGSLESVCLMVLRWSMSVLMFRGRSLCLFLCLPFGMLCLSAVSMVLVSMVFRVCTFSGVCRLISVFSMSVVNCFQLAFL